MGSEIEGPYGSQLKKVDVVKVGMMKALREIGNLQEQMQHLEVGWLCVRSWTRACSRSGPRYDQVVLVV